MDKPTAPAGQQQYMHLMQRIEARFMVSRWHMGGIEVWPLIRIHGLFASSAITGGAPAPGRLRQFLTMARREATSALSAFYATCRTQRMPEFPLDAMLLSDGVSYMRPMRGAPWYDRFCDPLREHLDRLGRTHATFVPGGARLPLARPAYSLHNHLRMALALAPAGRFPTDMPGFPEVAAIMQGELGWQPSLRWLERHVRRIHAYAWWYGRLLNRLRPRCVFLVSYYNDEGFGLLHAAHQRSITTIDIQHGAQGEIHPAYAPFATSPGTGWSLLPRRFWVWSEAEARAISAWGLPDHAADAVGNVMLDRRLIELGRRAARSDHPATLLITLQPGFDGSGYYRLLCDVIAALPTRMHIWIRVHPAQLCRLGAISARFSGLGSHCSIREPSLSPLYDLLPQSSVHLTHSSSTVIEAAALGVPSVVFDPLGAAMYADQLRAGQAILATTPAAIATQIARLAAMSRVPAGIEAATQRLGILGRRLDELTGPRGSSAA